MANLPPLMSTGKDDWETPDEIFETYNALYHFDLDAAADATNHKTPRWYGPGGEREDALSPDPWVADGAVWLNPPYSRGLQAQFVRRALRESFLSIGDTLMVCLLPARTDTKLFHEIIEPHGQVRFIKGRLKFKGALNGAPFPSMIVIF